MWKILGIEQTRDIRVIKSAYARLVKEYNPEEYPEQFKLIYEAYKDACEYAKTGCIVIRSLGIAIKVRDDDTVPPPHQEKNGEASPPLSDEFDFGAVNACSDEVKEHEGEEQSEEEFDFGAVDVSSDKTEKAQGAKPSVSDFDFGNINTEKIGCEYKMSYGERLRRAVLNMRRLIADKNRKNVPENWIEFFVYGDFETFRKDGNFRKLAAESLRYTQFEEESALIIASAFGNGSYITPANSRVEGKWTVVINESTDENSRPPDNRCYQKTFAEDFFSCLADGKAMRAKAEKLRRKLFGDR